MSARLVAAPTDRQAESSSRESNPYELLSNEGNASTPAADFTACTLTVFSTSRKIFLLFGNSFPREP